MDDWIDVTMSADTARRYERLRPVGAPSPWPFGTVVRPKDNHGNTRRLMVVLDNGAPSFSAVMVKSATTREVGSIDHRYARNRWEPDTP